MGLLVVAVLGGGLRWVCWRRRFGWKIAMGLLAAAVLESDASDGANIVGDGCISAAPLQTQPRPPAPAAADEAASPTTADHKLRWVCYRQEISAPQKPLFLSLSTVFEHVFSMESSCMLCCK
ncbi:PREDICTED: uncharacterized protein LOC105952806 [Erythranthe guttata]|uniref:uncharacterized protein LOC105952806 n=1 Tax=Erythranthe guttata TaxID=4155 RepID=UPI00064DDA01|nr:PREDICTED: uncharacterized protein LOC105952806 [Erythranthe guttata]|eukprot:XP_012831840.1 PREDICTED: uncharacterized protein LOC105952806 [Erythranthe guttata]